MRSSPQVIRLSFVLPAGARLLANGTHRDWVKGCELVVAGPFIRINGPSRERVQEQAARVIRSCCQDLKDASIDATTESDDGLGVGGRRQSWTIVVNADIAFVPSSLGATFPVLEETADGAPAVA